MKKFFFSLLVAISLCSVSYAQTDSVPALLKCSPKNYKLQWEEGFTAVAFKNALLTGVSVDFIGIQYKKIMHISIGAEQATNNINFNPGYTDPKAYTAENAHMAYFVDIEPIIFPDHLFNITIPVKFAYAANVFAHNSLYKDNFNFSPGVNASIHLMQNLSLGMGMSYRFAMAMVLSSTTLPDLTNDNYTLWMFLRISLK